jgi:hypothetical protein
MKSVTVKRGLALGLTLLYADVTAALAAESARAADNSNLFVYIFLGFCALIIIAQLAPAVMMVLGFAKGAKKKTLEAVPATVDQK